MIERTLGSTVAFDGRLLKLEVLDVEVEPGVTSVREVVRHRGAAVVLGRLPDGRFAFVKQYRKAIERELIEAVAGTLDPGENPDECASRELTEETGHRAESLEKIGILFPAPGYVDERLHLYYARLAPEAGATATDADERVEVVCLDGNQIDDMIASGEICDAKTVALWHLYRARDPDRNRL